MKQERGRRRSRGRGAALPATPATAARSPRCWPTAPTRRRSTTPSRCGTSRTAGRSTSASSTSSGSTTPRQVERRGELPGVHQQHRQGRLRERHRGRPPGRSRPPGRASRSRSKELPKPQGPGHAWTLDDLLAASKDQHDGPQLQATASGPSPPPAASSATASAATAAPPAPT